MTSPADTRPPRPRRGSSPLARIGIGLFAAGLAAVVVIMVPFATGARDLPLWLNLLAMLAPVGFVVGLLAVYVEARTPPSRPPAGRPGPLDGPGGRRR